MKHYVTCLLMTASVCMADASVSTRYTIEISASGAISHDGQDLSSESLAAKLRELASSNANHEVLISASERAPLAVVTKVMDLCRKSGITKFLLQSR